MPKALHRKLVRQYRKKGLTGEELDHAVYGTMAKVEKGKKRRITRRKRSESSD